MYDLYFSFAYPSIVTISITTARLQLEPFIIAMNSTGPQPPCLAAMPWWPDDDVDTFKPLILVYHWLEKVTINPYEVFREETLITLVLSGQFLTHRTFKTWQHGYQYLYLQQLRVRSIRSTSYMVRAMVVTSTRQIQSP